MKYVSVFTALGIASLLGCAGPEGVPGENGGPGAVGSPGPSGTSCWDLNMDGMCNASEDVDGSGACDAADCRKATSRIYHDASHLSGIVLPVINAGIGLHEK